MQLSDNNAFPPLEPNHTNRNNDGKMHVNSNSMQSNVQSPYNWSNSGAENFDVTSSGESSVD